VGDDGDGAAHGLAHLVVADHVPAGDLLGRLGGAVLHEHEVVVVPAFGGPGVDPVHHPVEGMVVGADGDEDHVALG
jgi:hypothetical protein